MFVYPLVQVIKYIKGIIANIFFILSDPYIYKLKIILYIKHLTKPKLKQFRLLHG